MLTGLGSGSSFSSATDSGSRSGSGSSGLKPGRPASTLQAGTACMQAAGLESFRGPVFKATSSSQGSRPTGRASSMQLKQVDNH